MYGLRFSNSGWNNTVCGHRITCSRCLPNQSPKMSDGMREVVLSCRNLGIFSTWQASRVLHWRLRLPQRSHIAWLKRSALRTPWSATKARIHSHSSPIWGFAADGFGNVGRASDIRFILNFLWDSQSMAEWICLCFPRSSGSILFALLVPCNVALFCVTFIIGSFWSHVWASRWETAPAFCFFLVMFRLCIFFFFCGGEGGRNNVLSTVVSIS